MAGEERVVRILETLVEDWLARGDRTITEPRSINEGPCAEFAEEARKLLEAHLPGIAVEVLCEEDVLAPDGVELPNWFHTFIVVGGSYHDAEATAGVHDWRDLPFFRRVAHCLRPVEPEEGQGPGP